MPPSFTWVDWPSGFLELIVWEIDPHAGQTDWSIGENPQTGHSTTNKPQDWLT
jgi:hypothetical protein